MSGFKREYTDPKEAAKDLLKVGVGKLVEKGFKKIPGYTKVKETIDKSGFSLSAGKDSVGITFTKKLGGKKKKKKKYD
jgi:hypothetical protein|tara:strand:- start:1629 stop:1862 length:234 start_codon:yes stop_codon:yes gene_type:complete